MNGALAYELMQIQGKTSKRDAIARGASWIKFEVESLKVVVEVDMKMRLLLRV
jgi:hypothetical protein